MNWKTQATFLIGATLVCAFLHSTANAQQVACGFRAGMAGQPLGPAIPDQGKGFQLCRTIAHVWRVTPPPVFMQQGINNAYAITNGPFGGGHILYDPILLNEVERRYGPAAALGILAHEMGHIVTGIQLPGLPNQSDEARADYFAGITLARLGVGRKGLQAYMMNHQLIGGLRYPDGVSRARIIEMGYLQAGGHPLNN